jgi:hypothetical protein
MATNRDLLKEAIADAKAVKETAIANAKVALEEAFTPYLKERFAAKLAEIEKTEEDIEEGAEMETEGYDVDENMYETDEDPTMETLEEPVDEDLDLEALLRELEDETNKEMDQEEMTKAKEEDEDEDENKEGEEEVSLEDMTEDELRDLIEDVIAGMVEAGELEGNIEGEKDEEEDKEEEDEKEMIDEVDIDELMAEIKRKKIMNFKDHKEIEEAKRRAAKAEKELKEAYATLEEIQASLQEVKLLNAKLLYTNKIFRAKNLTESQKVKVLESFDKATSVKEAKLVYETLNEGLRTKKPINESIVRGLASKAVGSIETKKPIFEVDSQFARWQVLAGIKNND